MNIINPLLVTLTFTVLTGCSEIKNEPEINSRERISLNEGWRFMKYDSLNKTDNLIYDVRPEVTDYNDSKDADSKPTEAKVVEQNRKVLKAWILPTANEFIKDTSKHYKRPAGNPGKDFPFVQENFNDSVWEKVTLPHDWGIKGPFLEGKDAEAGGGMGRLPSHGIAWYRKKIDINESDKGKSIFLDIDGAMSYAMVWLNGNLVGGWPYGYNSFRLDLTPYVNFEGTNQLAIRIDNPPDSARWYPGGGIYRNVWLTKANSIHVNHWGTYVTAEQISPSNFKVKIKIKVSNYAENEEYVLIKNKIYELDKEDQLSPDYVASFPESQIKTSPEKNTEIGIETTLNNPKLWGPPPSQTPNRYVIVTSLYNKGKLIDEYKTPFGIRQLQFNPEKGIIINGEPVKIKGVNQHHDLGSLGAAFNTRAAERQLEILKEMGCNAIRLAHNPPAPELLNLTDKIGFLVIDEIFDVWERKKTPLDFHLIFPEWHEADTRAFVRRDRNHPSVIMWSFGNEVGEQYTDNEGAELGKKLNDIIKEEDPMRPTTASMNFAKPDMPFPASMDVISLNYQGEGIRDTPAYSHLKGIKTSPLYPEFHKKFPDKVIISSETASALSTRGTYLFPVFEGISAPAEEGNGGGNPESQYVNSYELYTAPFGASADKVFASQDKHPYVAGEFVWSGWDYLGEPTPYYSSRSSYCGIIDLAGFKKDRFYLYQARWRPDLHFAHILPHWNWPDRIGKVTPVHVITSGDEAELFLNGQSLGKKRKGQYEYRFRWDKVKYQPGELKVVTYKNGKIWAKNSVKTTGAPYKLIAFTDRGEITSNGKDLSFVTVKVVDEEENVVPDANNLIEFYIEGSGRIIATDNGDPTDMNEFQSNKRKAFNGLALGIINSVKNNSGNIKVIVKSDGLQPATVNIHSK
ncbi:beta-galactosidase GalB [Abyssalbus ytuae]|uniref:DUF4982 domain-containing protein n=1 Tax=Abyssalbus ytuae TaxID=2926907 RepID=A0A9E6ZKT4_9FLAO|nr:beta-galactosidase GalB [Abyssalbus ytuae]UOB17579.1 DUF4982 domain-containing protein [Abyssalbus ytuae]